MRVEVEKVIRLRGYKIMRSRGTTTRELSVE